MPLSTADIVDSMIQELIEGDPNLFPASERANLVHPDTMELLRQQGRRVTGRVVDSSRPWVLPQKLGRTHVRALVEGLLGPLDRSRKASAEAVGFDRATLRSLMAWGRQIPPDRVPQRLLRELFLRRKTMMSSSARLAAVDQEFTRRQKWLKGMKKFLRSKGLGKGVLGLAALLLPLMTMQDARD
jgi:hypothetical protein